MYGFTQDKQRLVFKEAGDERIKIKRNRKKILTIAILSKRKKIAKEVEIGRTAKENKKKSDKK